MRKYHTGPRKPWREVFWSRVNKLPGRDACWLWTGGLDSDGYGIVCNARNSAVAFRELKENKAHRISWVLKHNKRVPDGKLILHTCDVRNCVRDSHLYDGTWAQNVEDRDSRKRAAWHKGTHWVATKLTVDQVKEIRLLHGRGTAVPKLAKLFSVSDSNVILIIKRRTWAKV